MKTFVSIGTGASRWGGIFAGASWSAALLRRFAGCAYGGVSAFLTECAGSQSCGAPQHYPVQSDGLRFVISLRSILINRSSRWRSKTLRVSARHQRGSTLLLAMWALFLLSATVMAWAKWIDFGLDDAREANLALEARALSHSGVAVALHPQVTTRTTELLNKEVAPDRSYEVTIVGEGGKLNLSYLLYGESPERLDILKRYLILRGFDLKQADHFIDCLLDWVDGNNTRRLNGAEEEADYKPANRPITSLDEIPQVRGSEPLLANPDWRDDLTLLSRGPLDLESAPAELLALIPGVGEARAEQFVRMRQGQDQKDGTDDDRIFNNLNEAVAALGLSQEQFAQIASHLSFRDPIVRVRSVGEAGNVRRQVDVVARKVEGGNPQILLWTEK